MINIETTQQFLQKHDYLAWADCMNDVVLASIPKKVNYPSINDMLVTYNIVSGGVSIFVKDLCSGDTFENKVKFLSYVRRTYIISHIIKNAIFIDYPFSLIDWRKEGVRTTSHDFFLSIKPPQKQYLKKEAALCAISMQGVSMGFCEHLEKEAENQDVLDGYLKIREIFISE